MTVLVTGATAGLGLAVARALAARGDDVVVHGRTAERAAAAGAEIGGRSRAVHGDLASLAAVRALADAAGHVDVLVNNAGIGAAPAGRAESADGIELRFAVNYLAGVLLADRLDPAFVVNVASASQHPIDLADPLLERAYDGRRAYRQSKLAQVMHALDLGPRGCAVHPGHRMPTRMVADLGHEPETPLEQGVEAVVAAIDRRAAGFLDGTEPARAHDQAYDRAARARVRALARELLSRRPARARG